MRIAVDFPAPFAPQESENFAAPDIEAYGIYRGKISHFRKSCARFAGYFFYTNIFLIELRSLREGGIAALRLSLVLRVENLPFSEKLRPLALATFFMKNFP